MDNTCPSMYTHTHARTTHVQVCTHTRTDNTCPSMYTYTHTHTHAHGQHVSRYVHTHTHKHADTTRPGRYTHIHMDNTCPSMYTHTHTHGQHMSRYVHTHARTTHVQVCTHTHAHGQHVSRYVRTHAWTTLVQVCTHTRACGQQVSRVVEEFNGRHSDSHGEFRVRRRRITEGGRRTSVKGDKKTCTQRKGDRTLTGEAGKDRAEPQAGGRVLAARARTSIGVSDTADRLPHGPSPRRPVLHTPTALRLHASAKTQPHTRQLGRIKMLRQVCFSKAGEPPRIGRLHLCAQFTHQHDTKMCSGVPAILHKNSRLHTKNSGVTFAI